ncbi:SDR family oxidoreductase [Salirhabdus euzebyi]|nr:SDR family oxidoreductase [Salirhabdus euzebyi]
MTNKNKQKVANPKHFPPQHQPIHPGLEALMVPKPKAEDPCYKGTDKLKGKVAIISSGDSGIGKAVAIAFAKEGADIVIAYLNEHIDARNTKGRIEEIGQQCLLVPCDLGSEHNCHDVVDQTLKTFGKLDILVNNCAEAHPKKSITEINAHQLYRVFQTNIFSYFFLTKAALPYLKSGNTIINTTSEVAYNGQEDNIDYAATKGAIVTFTRSLALQLVGQNIRVNGIAPGPIWTPIIPSSFPAEQMTNFGTGTPIGRAGQPYELALAYVYLASSDSSYVTGQVIHVNGGTMTSS